MCFIKIGDYIDNIEGKDPPPLTERLPSRPAP